MRPAIRNAGHRMLVVHQLQAASPLFRTLTKLREVVRANHRLAQAFVAGIGLEHRVPQAAEAVGTVNGICHPVITDRILSAPVTLCEKGRLCRRSN